MLLELGLVGALALGAGAIWLGWLRGRKARAMPGASLPPEWAGRLRELEALRTKTREVVARHELEGTMVDALAQLDRLVETYGQLAAEAARQRDFLAETPRKAVEREVERLRARAVEASGAEHDRLADKLALAEQKLALVSRLDDSLASIRERLGMIEDTMRLIHGHAVAAATPAELDLDLRRVAESLGAADEALAEVRALASQRAALTH